MVHGGVHMRLVPLCSLGELLTMCTCPRGLWPMFCSVTNPFSCLHMRRSLYTLHFYLHVSIGATRVGDNIPSAATSTQCHLPTFVICLLQSLRGGSLSCCATKYSSTSDHSTGSPPLGWIRERGYSVGGQTLGVIAEHLGQQHGCRPCGVGSEQQRRDD